jgi:molybdopterin-guanine dinucleotide biosynthesis protein A
MQSSEAVANIAGLVLAGGLSRRMGRDKSLMPLAGRPLLAHAVERFRPQVSRLAINANGDPTRFAAFDLPVIPDSLPGQMGPLAGILAGLKWAAAAGFEWLATSTVDSPFVPLDLVARLSAASGGTMIAVARSEGRVHPVFGLFPVALAADLAGFLERDVTRSVNRWLAGQASVSVDFAPAAPGGPDPFLNINTPGDLAIAESAIAMHKLPNR